MTLISVIVLRGPSVTYELIIAMRSATVDVAFIIRAPRQLISTVRLVLGAMKLSTRFICPVATNVAPCFSPVSVAALSLSTAFNVLVIKVRSQAK